MYKNIFKYLKQRHRIPLVGLLCLIAVYATAQSYLSSNLDFSIGQVDQTPKKKQDSVKRQKPKGPVKHIVLNKASLVEQKLDLPYQILTDSVQFTHDGAKLFCDSAHFNSDENSFEAFSNVRMEQGDTLFLYGNYMFYDGNTKLATVRENVRLENGSATLFTDNLDYDRVKNIGYYFDGGMLVDSNKDGENVLTSFWGQYEPNIKLATFTDSVKLVNPKFTLYSDMLKYSTQTKIAFITTPTRIVSDSGVIHTSRGRYNTSNEQATLLDQSVIVNKEATRYLSGDSIAYDKLAGIGKVFGNMLLQDTLKKVILRGNYGYYEEKNDFAQATDSAYCIEYSQGDSLYLHGDTLQLKTDSIYRDIKAYYNVRFYRSDMQGVCDSMQFNSRDSVLHLYRDPILWNKGNQLSGDTIDIFMNDSTVDYIHVKKYSFSVEQLDSIRFNQLKGRSLKAFVEDKKVKRVLVEGNVESIFYPRDDKSGDIIGMNWLESSYLEMHMDSAKLKKLKVWPKSNGKMTPLEMVIPSTSKLKDFYWYDYIRPVDKYDIFRKVSKKAEDTRPKKSPILVRPDDDEYGYGL